MHRVKDAISFLVLLFVLWISLAAVVQVARQELPSQQADPVDLGYWLTERDLAAESRDTKSKLLRRMEEELTSRRDRRGQFADLDEVRRKRLEQNLSLLFQQWVLEKADHYHSLPEAERNDYLDAELDKVTAWIAKRLPGDDNSKNPFPVALAGLVAVGPQIQAWIKQADPDQQPRLREFQRALQNRLIVRETQRIFVTP
jgi:hypothetical protein